MTVETRIFLGFLLTKEIKLHLSQSPSWKEAKLLGTQELIETQFQEKDYLGQFISQRLSCAQLKKLNLEIRSQLHQFCPKLDLEKQHSFLFSQLFFL